MFFIIIAIAMMIVISIPILIFRRIFFQKGFLFNVTFSTLLGGLIPLLCFAVGDTPIYGNKDLLLVCPLSMVCGFVTGSVIYRLVGKFKKK